MWILRKKGSSLTHCYQWVDRNTVPTRYGWLKNMRMNKWAPSIIWWPHWFCYFLCFLVRRTKVRKCEHGVPTAITSIRNAIFKSSQKTSNLHLHPCVYAFLQPASERIPQHPLTGCISSMLSFRDQTHVQLNLSCLCFSRLLVTKFIVTEPWLPAYDVHWKISRECRKP